ncbi:hypothetical protein LWI28_013216 [Acer negundo]|uniref:Uncharacterized protein n=1 Tax=Acer negundo TaxID=4023 RepID=A0AAD5NJD8_ACENE|nr:hypothetical protein LWI28_013216 [Acer negundo]
MKAVEATTEALGVYGKGEPEEDIVGGEGGEEADEESVRKRSETTRSRRGKSERRDRKRKRISISWIFMKNPSLPPSLPPAPSLVAVEPNTITKTQIETIIFQHYSTNNPTSKPSPNIEDHRRRSSDEIEIDEERERDFAGGRSWFGWVRSPRPEKIGAS